MPTTPSNAVSVTVITNCVARQLIYVNKRIRPFVRSFRRTPLCFSLSRKSGYIVPTVPTATAIKATLCKNTALCQIDLFSVDG